jgi:alanine racemase
MTSTSADGVRRENMNSQTHLGLYWKQKKLPFVGRISMDLCMVDASDTECQVGDWLYWIGENQGVDIHADRLGTISYEVLCALGSRFLRKMVNSEMEAKGVKLP